MRSVAFAASLVLILFVSLGAARIQPAEANSFNDYKKIESYSVAESPEQAVVTIFKLYDFVDEIDIDGYVCRMGPYPTEFPQDVSASECNRQFTEITGDDRLDWPDEDAVGGPAWHNYATHHLFVLKNVNECRLRRFIPAYVVYNDYYETEENYHLYVRNFDSGEWELLDEAYVDRYEQELLGYCSGFGGQTEYVENGEMWFMGTEKALAGGSIGSDAFAVLLRFSIFPGMQAEQEVVLAPSWMNGICSA